MVQLKIKLFLRKLGDGDDSDTPPSSPANKRISEGDNDLQSNAKSPRLNRQEDEDTDEASALSNSFETIRCELEHVENVMESVLEEEDEKNTKLKADLDQKTAELKESNEKIMKKDKYIKLLDTKIKEVTDTLKKVVEDHKVVLKKYKEDVQSELVERERRLFEERQRWMEFMNRSLNHGQELFDINLDNLQDLWAKLSVNYESDGTESEG